MANRYGTIITAKGAAKIAAAIADGTKLNIVYAAAGDGGGAYYLPTIEQTSLLGERWRGEIASAALSTTVANMIDVKFIIPDDVGGFTIREMALFDAAGDMIAVCNTPDTAKVAISEGVSGKITMVMHILVADASVVSFTIDPSLDTVSRAYLDQRLAEFAGEVGSAAIVRVTIPADGWEEAEDTTGLDGYGYAADIAVPEALDAHFPVAALDIACLAAAGDAGLCPTILAGDGFLRFWAQSVPAADLTGTVALRSANLAATDDTPVGDVATDDEVDDTLDDVFGDNAADDAANAYGVATDAEVEEVTTGIFGNAENT